MRRGRRLERSPQPPFSKRRCAASSVFGCVERTFAWLGRCRRLAKDWEKSVASAEAWINIAHIRLTTRRLARYCHV